MLAYVHRVDVRQFSVDPVDLLEYLAVASRPRSGPLLRVAEGVVKTESDCITNSVLPFPYPLLRSALRYLNALLPCFLSQSLGVLDLKTPVLTQVNHVLEIRLQALGRTLEVRRDVAHN